MKISHFLRTGLLPALLFLSMVSYAQTATVSLPAITPPSANATSLGLYGQFPVSLSTGTTNISIPIYEVQSAQLKLPISISYHSNGIKVHEDASCVGLGWSLNAGGAITRQVNDVPDMSPLGFNNINVPEENTPIPEKKNYFAGRSSVPDPTELATKYDSQPDNYYFNFAGQGGEFIETNPVIAKLSPRFTAIPYSALNISFNRSNNRFLITGTDGTIYVFGKSVKDSSLAVETSASEHTMNYIESPVTAWYLTEMISADHTDVKA